MPHDDVPRGPGRPRLHPSSRARALAYERRAAAAGLVRVSVMVPASRADDIKAIAAAMRSARPSQARAEPGQPRARYPRAGRTWLPEEDDTARFVWQHGGTIEELASLQRPLDEILARLVFLEEAGSIAEARAEFAARDRAEQLAGIRGLQP